MKLLAIDDNSNNLTTLKALLAFHLPEASLATAMTGRGGIALARDLNPDAILLDIQMPEMDGYEAARILRGDSLTRHIPIIMLTALHTDTGSKVKALDAGADAFLAKPLDETELVAQVRAMVRIKRSEDALRKERDWLEEQVAERTQELRHELATRRKAEEERALFQKQLHQSQKMESIGSLAGGIAHDFNNKLSVILGCAYMAHTEQDTDQLQQFLDEIRKAAEQSADLTRQLLAFASKQAIIPRVLGLNETVTGMLKMLDRLIGEDIRLSWQPAPDLWLLKFDPSQMDQILANLCVNARDSISKDGKITIETGNSSIGEEYAVYHPEAKPGDYVRLVVSDNGSGMDKETQLRIFEPFFTTKEIGKGTGLGLATVFGIVKQNSGFIDVHSEPGVGTTFTIHLPRHLGKNTPAENKSMITPAPVGQETILLVEDELAILNIASIILSKQGYTVLSANSPAEAIRLAKENADEINLLITDVIMPDMNGKELTNILQALYPHLRSLYMSGHTADAIAIHGVLDDGVNFIQKPFSLPDLAVKVRAVIDGK